MQWLVWFFEVGTRESLQRQVLLAKNVSQYFDRIRDKEQHASHHSKIEAAKEKKGGRFVISPTRANPSPRFWNLNSQPTRAFRRILSNTNRQDPRQQLEATSNFLFSLVWSAGHTFCWINLCSKHWNLEHLSLYIISVCFAIQCKYSKKIEWNIVLPLLNHFWFSNNCTRVNLI